MAGKRPAPRVVPIAPEVVSDTEVMGSAMMDDFDWEMDADADAVSIEELQEFMSGDLYASEAAPDFKERLRLKLWALVRERYGAKD